MKLFTSACLIGSVILCFVYMWLLAHLQHLHGGKAARLAAVEELAATTFLMILFIVGASVGAILIVKRAKALYREEATRNMKELVELTKKERSDGAG